MEANRPTPIANRSVRRVTNLRYGDFPISRKMGKEYLMACRTTCKVIRSGVATPADALAISQAKGMYGRCYEQDRPDWSSVWILLGQPDRAVSQRCRLWLGDLRKRAAAGESVEDLIKLPIAVGIARTLSRAEKALVTAGFDSV